MESDHRSILISERNKEASQKPQVLTRKGEGEGEGRGRGGEEGDGGRRVSILEGSITNINLYLLD